MSVWRPMDGGLWCTGSSDKDHPHGKEVQNYKVTRAHRELRTGVNLNERGKGKLHIWMQRQKE